MNTSKQVNPFMAVLAVNNVLAESHNVKATPAVLDGVTVKTSRPIDTTPRKAEATDHKRSLARLRQQKRRMALRSAILDSATQGVLDGKDKDDAIVTAILAHGCVTKQKDAQGHAAERVTEWLVNGAPKWTFARDIDASLPGFVAYHMTDDTRVATESPIDATQEGKRNFTRDAQAIRDTVNNAFKGFSKVQGKVKVYDLTESNVARLTENEVAYRSMNRAERSKANPLMTVRVLTPAESSEYSKYVYTAPLPTERTHGAFTNTERLDRTNAKPVAGKGYNVVAADSECKPTCQLGYYPLTRDIIVRRCAFGWTLREQDVRQQTVHSESPTRSMSTEIGSALVTMAQVAGYSPVAYRTAKTANTRTDGVKGVSVGKRTESHPAATITRGALIGRENDGTPIYAQGVVTFTDSIGKDIPCARMTGDSAGWLRNWSSLPRDKDDLKPLCWPCR
jgi:hypothetical protein